MLQNVIYTSSVIAPVFLIVLVGYWLKKRHIIDQQFNSTASKIVFNITLPALVFTNISSTRFAQVFDGDQVLFVSLALLGTFALIYAVSGFFCSNGKDQGAFIQGAFRSNYAILGFGMISNAFGPSALANAAIVLAFIMPLYNLLSVVALTLPMHKESAVRIKKTARDILTNPLVITTVAALPFSYFEMGVHPIFKRTIDYLANLTLPLALLAIGGALSFRGVTKEMKLAVWSASIKIFWMPVLCVPLAYYLGFRGAELGVLFFLFANPTAVASYAMADAMGSNRTLAGNIILVSTLGSIVTLSVGLFLCRTLGLF